jgi:hypothetical protein
MWRVGNWVIESARDRDAALGQAYLEGHEEGARLGVKMVADTPPEAEEESESDDA